MAVQYARQRDGGAKHRIRNLTSQRPAPNGAEYLDGVVRNRQCLTDQQPEPSGCPDVVMADSTKACLSGCRSFRGGLSGC